MEPQGQGWFKAGPAATQFIASSADVWVKACQGATQFMASTAGVYDICQNMLEVHSSWSQIPSSCKA